MRLAIASHNLRSVAHAIAANRARWGARTASSSSRCCAGWATTSPRRWPRSDMRVRIYCPVGDMVAGMAYLVRRLLENTANESFLGDQHAASPSRSCSPRRGPREAFANEPVLELRRAPVRETLLEALRELDARLPLSVPLLIDGERGSAAEGLVSTDPGTPPRGWSPRAGRGGEAEAAAAVEAAERGFREWGARPAAERAEVLRGAAARLRDRRLELAALQVRECAKPWPEADADVCEAIDFLEYYAREAIELDRGRELVQAPGERNTMRYAPRGVAAVIAPWNFPLAIPCGMTAAALAAGQRGGAQAGGAVAGSALALVEALQDAGVPRDALALLPGHGEAGAALVRDPRVHVIAFTGSAPVGLEILRAAAETPESQRHVKRVVVRDGRQELRDRGRRRRSRRGGAGARALRLRLRGAEMLGRGARAGPRGGRRARWSSAWAERSTCCAWGRPTSSPPRCRR